MGKSGQVLYHYYFLDFGFVLLKHRKLALIHLVATFSKSPPVGLGVGREGGKLPSWDKIPIPTTPLATIHRIPIVSKMKKSN